MYQKLSINLILGFFLSMLIVFPSFASTQDDVPNIEKPIAPPVPPKIERVEQVILFIAAQCVPLSQMAEMLEKKYGELPFVVGNGLITLAAGKNKGAVANTKLVLTVNPKTNTFTVTGLMPDKMTCLIMSGEKFAPAMLPKQKPKNLNYLPKGDPVKYTVPKLDALD
tara:strand:+ start:1058 stop:1558 length:501 start_codon:yes stop_codon:yes gene_type:complete